MPRKAKMFLRISSLSFSQSNKKSRRNRLARLLSSMVIVSIRLCLKYYRLHIWYIKFYLKVKSLEYAPKG